MSRLRTAAATLLLAALALAPAVVALWPHLPPLFEDELLPLVPVAPFLKEPESYGGALLSNPHVELLGRPLLLVSYVIEGPLKALCYVAALPLTRAAYRPESIIAAYRASNVLWAWALFAAVLGACRALGGWVAALFCVGLLVPDHAFVYLGLTDLSRPLHLVFGVVLLRLLCRHVDEPRWRNALLVALVTCAGFWNRADFLWFTAAGVVACLIVDVSLRRTTTLAVLVGSVVGLGLVGAVVPTYLGAIRGGHRIALTDAPRLWAHLHDLAFLIDPWGSYRRHLDVAPHIADPAYVAYRWAYVAACVLVPIGLGVMGLRARRGAYVVAALLPLLLLAAMVDTAESYEVHHVTVVKPGLYVAASVLAADLARRRQVPVVVAWAALAAAALWVHVRAFADVVAAAPARGIYGVTWNMSEAWQAATRSEAKLVVGVDFGVWVPGLLSSPPDQRWESTGFPDEASLDQEMAGQRLVGFVVRADGPNAWLLATTRYRVVARWTFDAHPGDPWAFLLLAGS